MSKRRRQRIKQEKRSTNCFFYFSFLCPSLQTSLFLIVTHTHREKEKKQREKERKREREREREKERKERNTGLKKMAIKKNPSPLPSP
jgi:hypothetical protein